MKIGILGNIIEYDARGISRMISYLFNTINKLYPDIQIYLLSEHPLKRPFCNHYNKIPKNPKNISYEGLDYLVLPFNGRDGNPYLGLRPNLKIISIIHDITPGLLSDDSKQLSKVPTYKNKEYLSETQKVLNYTDILFTVSQNTAKDLDYYLNMPSKLFANIIMPAPMLPNFTVHNSNFHDSFFIYNGGYDVHKGIDLLVENFLQLRLTGEISSDLILTGAKYPLGTRTDKLINYGKYVGYIKELGYVSDKKLAELIDSAVALVYPSVYEGFGIPPLEAMHIGCPVITTKVSSMPEICGDAAYYIINRNNSIEFQNALVELETNQVLRENLIKKGKEVAGKFSWENTTNLFIDALKKNLSST